MKGKAVRKIGNDPPVFHLPAGEGRVRENAPATACGHRFLAVTDVGAKRLDCGD
jgi:hypothetical protein